MQEDRFVPVAYTVTYHQPRDEPGRSGMLLVSPTCFLIFLLFSEQKQQLKFSSRSVVGVSCSSLQLRTNTCTGKRSVMSISQTGRSASTGPSSSRDNGENFAFSIVSSLPGEEQEEAPVASSGNCNHMVLHFDINETILVGDEAGGDTREDSLNKILAKSAFVRKPVADADADGSSHEETSLSCLEPTHWWNGEPICDNENDYNNLLEKSNTPPLYTGWHWPEGCCPYYRTSFKSRSQTFIQHHGALYKDIYDEMNRRLQPTATGSNTPIILSHMLPAFFETISALSKQKFATGQPYTLVFRTMGTDLPEIAEAVTAFARGQHPEYPDFEDLDLVLTPDKLVQGRWAELPDNNNDDGNNDSTRYVFQLWKEKSLVASGDAQVLEFLHSHTVCGIQDDYAFWKSQGFAPWAGKPVWIPRDTNYHHVLMDDNIHNLPNDSIASARVERQTKDGIGKIFQTLSGPEILEKQGLYLIRVPTVEPILNPNWFLERIERAQRDLTVAHQKCEGSL
jgi:hypothetical protein